MWLTRGTNAGSAHGSPALSKAVRTSQPLAAVASARPISGAGVTTATTTTTVAVHPRSGSGRRSIAQDRAGCGLLADAEMATALSKSKPPSKSQPTDTVTRCITERSQPGWSSCIPATNPSASTPRISASARTPRTAPTLLARAEGIQGRRIPTPNSRRRRFSPSGRVMLLATQPVTWPRSTKSASRSSGTSLHGGLGATSRGIA
jgi:hypothetical protein